MDNYDVLYLKIVNVISNLYTKKHMRGKNRMAAEERWRKYSLHAQKNILSVAKLLDEQEFVDLHLTSYLRGLIER